MATRNILLDGDNSLLKKSRAVTNFNKRLHVLLDDMRETLIQADGLGLSAPQVGVLRRVVLVLDTTIEEDNEDNIIELVNPEILNSSGEQTGQEGCLSIPNVYGLVTRPLELRVRAQDRYGVFFEKDCADLTARAVCHEIDHLEGRLFKDIADKILTPEELEELAKEKETQ